jgi:hypothetical protein
MEKIKKDMIDIGEKNHHHFIVQRVIFLYTLKVVLRLITQNIITGNNNSFFILYNLNNFLVVFNNIIM